MTDPVTHHLSHRAVLTVSGETAQAFLQNLVSNDMLELDAREWRYAALLTPQGKFHHDMFVARHEDQLVLDVDRDSREELLKRLMMYRMRQPVALSLNDELAVVWQASGEGTQRAVFHAPDPRHSELGQRGLIAVSDVAGLPTDLTEYHAQRMRLAVAENGFDIARDKDTLAEHHFEAIHGVSYVKGCYIGQEVTARMKHRALLKKSLRCLQFDGMAPDADTSIHSGDRKITDIRASSGNLATAIIRHADLDKPLQTQSGQVAEILPLPASHQLPTEA